MFRMLVKEFVLTLPSSTPSDGPPKDQDHSRPGPLSFEDRSNG